MNNKDLLEPSLFIKATIYNYIKASIITLLIIGRGKRVLRNALNRLNNTKVDLILYNVVVIKGFYINIIIKALLLRVNI